MSRIRNIRGIFDPQGLISFGGNWVHLFCIGMMRHLGKCFQLLYLLSLLCRTLVHGSLAINKLPSSTNTHKFHSTTSMQVQTQCSDLVYFAQLILTTRESTYIVDAWVYVLQCHSHCRVLCVIQNILGSFPGTPGASKLVPESKYSRSPVQTPAPVKAWPGATVPCNMDRGRCFPCLAGSRKVRKLIVTISGRFRSPGSSVQRSGNIPGRPGPGQWSFSM